MLRLKASASAKSSKVHLGDFLMAERFPNTKRHRQSGCALSNVRWHYILNRFRNCFNFNAKRIERQWQGAKFARFLPTGTGFRKFYCFFSLQLNPLIAFSLSEFFSIVGPHSNVNFAGRYKWLDCICLASSHVFMRRKLFFFFCLFSTLEFLCLRKLSGFSPYWLACGEKGKPSSQKHTPTHTLKVLMNFHAIPRLGREQSRLECLTVSRSEKFLALASRTSPVVGGASHSLNINETSERAKLWKPRVKILKCGWSSLTTDTTLAQGEQSGREVNGN